MCKVQYLLLDVALRRASYCGRVEFAFEFDAVDARIVLALESRNVFRKGNCVQVSLTQLADRSRFNNALA